MHPADLTVEHLRGLLQQAEPPCLTITLPLEPTGGTSEQTRIRLKDLAVRAERALEARQVARREITALLTPVRQLAETGVAAHHGDAGFAILRTADIFEHVATPYPLRDAALVADRLYIKPLVPLIQDGQRYFVLALAQNRVRLYQGDRYGLSPVTVPDLPDNATDALRYDDRRNPVQFHTGTAAGGRSGGGGGGGQRPAMFHGQALGREEQKESAFRFCELVENAVTRFLDDRRVPLLIAAAEPLDALYRRANQYATLHASPVRGNPEPWSEKELHQRTWEVIRTSHQHEAQHQLERLEEALRKNRGASDVTSALPASKVARIETLLVSLERDQWGRLDAQGERIELASGPAPDAEELTNWIAAETLQHGGAVFTVPADALPAGATIGAIYRFPVT